MSKFEKMFIALYFIPCVTWWVTSMFLMLLLIQVKRQLLHHINNCRDTQNVWHTFCTMQYIKVCHLSWLFLLFFYSQRDCTIDFYVENIIRSDYIWWFYQNQEVCFKILVYDIISKSIQNKQKFFFGGGVHKGVTLFIKTWGQHLNSSQHGCVVWVTQFYLGINSSLLLGYAWCCWPWQ